MDAMFFSFFLVRVQRSEVRINLIAFQNGVLTGYDLGLCYKGSPESLIHKNVWRLREILPGRQLHQGNLFWVRFSYRLLRSIHLASPYYATIDSVLDRVLRVMDSKDCLTLTENTFRSSTPSRESILSEVLVSILTKYTPRESILRNHHF